MLSRIGHNGILVIVFILHASATGPNFGLNINFHVLTNIGVVPKDLNFGVSTAAFQVEGAWNVDGKGPSIWDTFSHQSPSPIEDGTNADRACDSYHKYKEDVAAAANLGVKYYRFSFSWPRILPTGYAHEINQKGIEYYRNLIDEILKHDMIPMATIFHWDLPQRLYDDGIDWTNPAIVEHIVNYARIVIEAFPEVGRWLTINEMKQICHMGYGTGLLAPGIKSSGDKEYQCSYNVLKAHAGIYRMYKKEFGHYTAPMTAALDCEWIEPITDTDEDEEAAERQRQFECGLYYHPIFKGDWPPIVKERIAKKSNLAKLSKSRLPEFTEEEIQFIKGTHDYIALNHYFTYLAADTVEGADDEISYDNDLGVSNSFSKNWVVESNGIFSIVPYGVRKVLQWLKRNYGDHEIVLSELGMTDDGSSLDDDIRIDFYNDYICNILEAIYVDHIHVTDVNVWALMDNFEWSSGYKPHFGLYHINQTDPNLTRVPKKSVQFFKNLISNRKLNCLKAAREWPGPSQWHYFGFRHSQIGLGKNRQKLEDLFNKLFKNSNYHIDFLHTL